MNLERKKFFGSHFPLSTALQGYSYDQRLENVDIDFNVPHMPIVALGQQVATVSATVRGNSPNLSQPNRYADRMNNPVHQAGVPLFWTVFKRTSFPGKNARAFTT